VLSDIGAAIAGGSHKWNFLSSAALRSTTNVQVSTFVTKIL